MKLLPNNKKRNDTSNYQTSWCFRVFMRMIDRNKFLNSWKYLESWKFFHLLIEIAQYILINIEYYDSTFDSFHLKFPVIISFQNISIHIRFSSSEQSDELLLWSNKIQASLLNFSLFSGFVKFSCHFNISCDFRHWNTRDLQFSYLFLCSRFLIPEYLDVFFIKVLPQIQVVKKSACIL